MKTQNIFWPAVVATIGLVIFGVLASHAASPKAAGSADSKNAAMVKPPPMPPANKTVVGTNVTNAPFSTNLVLSFKVVSNQWYWIYYTTNVTRTTGTLASGALTNLPWARWVYWTNLFSTSNGVARYNVPNSPAFPPKFFVVR
jgi:hypothetical protein